MSGRSLICRPKWATRRRPERPTFGGQLAWVADQIKTPMMPWQRQVANVAGEFDPETGIPYYREIILTVPRQSGKTTLFLAFQLHRCLMWHQLGHPRMPRRSVFTAQTGKDARDKWVDELMPQLVHSKPAIANALDGPPRKGIGNESVPFRDGSIIRIISTSESSGHSKTLDQAVLDEIWHDMDQRREQAVRPAMATRRDAQILLCSTAGTAASLLYHRKVADGRKAVERDRGRGIAYFEWSAPHTKEEPWDESDEDSWFTFMPALYHPELNPEGTIHPEVIRAELEGLDAAEFRRAYGNLSTPGDELLISEAAYTNVEDATVAPHGSPWRVGFELSEDTQTAAVAVCGGNGVVELVEYGTEISTVIAKANELAAKLETHVIYDKLSQSATVAKQLRPCVCQRGQDRGGHELSTAVTTAAVGTTFRAIHDRDVRFRADGALRASALAAEKRSVGDRWVWSRKGAVGDPTPLWAATLAYAGPDPERQVTPFVHRR